MVKIFKEYKEDLNTNLQYLTESENHQVDEWVNLFEKDNMKLQDIDEGFLGKLVGGVGGFLVGPTIGKIIAKALGIEKGVLYDMFTSRLVGAALGSAIAKHLGQKSPIK